MKPQHKPFATQDHSKELVKLICSHTHSMASCEISLDAAFKVKYMHILTRNCSTSFNIVFIFDQDDICCRWISLLWLNKNYHEHFEEIKKLNNHNICL